MCCHVLDWIVTVKMCGSMCIADNSWSLRRHMMICGTQLSDSSLRKGRCTASCACTGPRKFSSGQTHLHVLLLMQYTWMTGSLWMAEILMDLWVKYNIIWKGDRLLNLILMFHIILHSTHLHYKSNYTFSHPNLTSFSTQIQCKVDCPKVCESKRDHTNAIYLHSAEPKAHNSAVGWH